MQKKTSLLASAFMLCATPLFANMPLQTDDTGTQRTGHSQIEAGFQSASNEEDDGGVSHKSTNGALLTTLSYGLTDNIDLVAVLPLEWYTEKADGVKVTDESGLGDLALQIKWRFYNNADAGFSLALKPGLTLPTGDDNKGFGNGKVSGGVTLIATHKAKLTSMHFNLGYIRNEYRLEALSNISNKDIWRASIAAELNVNDKLRAVGDLGIATSTYKASDTNPAYILAGFIYGVSDNADLDIGIRGGLNDAETDTTLLAGVTMRF